MRKEVKIFGWLFVFCLVGVSMVSAEILISQPESVYNYGDVLNANITLSPGSTTNDFFLASLVCNSGSLEVYRSTVSTVAGKSKTFNVEINLDKSIIGGLTGSCSIKASYGGENAASQGFEISNLVKLSFETDSSLFEPGKAVGIIGKAVKANSFPLNGFVEFRVGDTDVSSSQKISDGKFNLSLSIPGNMAAGMYTLNAHAYEKSGDNIVMNEGNASTIVKVKAVVSGSDIAVINSSITPGDMLDYSVLLFDQTNQQITGQEMTLSIYNPGNVLFNSKIVKSGENQSMKIEGNYAPGNWIFEAIGSGVDIRKAVTISELQNASFEIINGSLVITNTGNVPYTRPVEIGIGNESQVKSLDLGLGEIKELRLLAPDGDYPIQVKEGDTVHPLGTSFLTGNVISVQDASGILTNSKYSAGIWIAIILIALVFGIKYYRKSREKKGYGNVTNYNFGSSSPRLVSPGLNNISKSNDSLSSVVARKPVRQMTSSIPAKNEPIRLNRKMTLGAPQEKEEKPVQRKLDFERNGPALVIRKTLGSGIEHGMKEEVALVALKIRNANEIESTDSNAKESVAKALAVINESGAKIIEDHNSSLAVFSSIQLGTEVYQKAMSVAREVEGILKEHNRKYVHKVAFGIGVHSGDIISEHSAGNFKFTSAGNAVPVVKRLAERAQSEIAVSEAAISKVRNYAKLEKVQKENYWKVLEGATRKSDGKYNEFIGQFMKRQKGGW